VLLPFGVLVVPSAGVPSTTKLAKERSAGLRALPAKEGTCSQKEVVMSE